MERDKETFLYCQTYCLICYSPEKEWIYKGKAAKLTAYNKETKAHDKNHLVTEEMILLPFEDFPGCQHQVYTSVSGNLIDKQRVHWYQQKIFNQFHKALKYLENDSREKFRHYRNWCEHHEYWRKNVFFRWVDMISCLLVYFYLF